MVVGSSAPVKEKAAAMLKAQALLSKMQMPMQVPRMTTSLRAPRCAVSYRRHPPCSSGSRGPPAVLSAGLGFNKCRRPFNPEGSDCPRPVVLVCVGSGMAVDKACRYACACLHACVRACVRARA